MFRFDTTSLSINAKPEKVWEYVADIHTSQGDVRVIEKFDREHLLLDTVCIVPSGDEQFIPYRVVPNGEGSELIITNQQTAGVSDAEYAEQLTWMREELKNIKKIMEAR